MGSCFRSSENEAQITNHNVESTKHKSPSTTTATTATTIDLLISILHHNMANDADLFGDSSSDADTDDLIAAAKSQPIAKKKGGEKKAPVKKDVPGEFPFGLNNRLVVNLM